jgi:hypothetical protein
MTNQSQDPALKKTTFPWLERVTTVVLLLVLLSLAWILTVAYQPKWLRVLSLDLEVVLVVGVLIVALGLVSLVALLHTQS